MATQVGDGNTPEKALVYFKDKMTFTTGPAELDRVLATTNDFSVIDVRAEKDFNEGHIPGSVSLPKDKWETCAGLKKDKLNVVLCYSQVCHLAATAAIEFAKNGYRVLELEGGFAGWKNQGLAIERTPKPTRVPEHPSSSQAV
jgi:rhodanese-related sulfurtransferase